MRNSQQSLWKRLRRDERGNVAAIFALSSIPVIGITGLAVDLGRAMQYRTQVQAAVDAAAVTAVRVSSDTVDQRIATAQQTFAANIAGMSNSTISVTPVVTMSNNTVTVTASGSVNTTMASLLGITSLDITASSSATMSSGKQVEVAMMIDLTGSMGETRSGQTKISGLKTAAADLLDILLPNGSSTLNTRVSVVPFADYVNAGEYAAAATGLAASGGSYSPITNLASTMNGPFSGSYTGITGNAAGSQAGVTPPSTTYAGQTSPAGSVFSNSYCANPTSTTTANVAQFNGVNMGVWIPNYWNNYSQYTGAPPAGVLKASSSQPVYEVYSYSSSYGYSYYTSGGYYASYSQPYAWTSDYYVPFVSNAGSMTVQTVTATAYNNNGYSLGSKTGPVGAQIYTSGYGSTPPAPAVNASSNGSGGYWNLTGIDQSGAPMYQWTTSGYYIPVYTSLSSTSTVPGCENTVMSQPSSKLISCVTERTGSEKYTDAAPGSYPVGSYGHGVSYKSNYSSDGKCYTAGRELPKIIPLTNDKTSLTNFFNTATIGGATPGHLGTAWAWYTLSPNWGSVWPSASQPAQYNTPNVVKAAILMTDGEYNVYYNNGPSRDQALALCQAMKDQGITVYTVGFGFSTTSSATDNTAEGKAKDLLTQCSSGTNHYYFPYDGAALRQAFSNIGQMISNSQTSQTSRLTQ